MSSNKKDTGNKKQPPAKIKDLYRKSAESDVARKKRKALEGITRRHRKEQIKDMNKNTKAKWKKFLGMDE